VKDARQSPEWADRCTPETFSTVSKRGDGGHAAACRSVEAVTPLGPRGIVDHGLPWSAGARPVKASNGGGLSR